jgi:putative membrane protein
MMVRDHTKAGDEFKQVLTRANAQVPAVSTDDLNDERERLAKLSGAEFDREYIKKMVDDHETTVDKVRDEAENGKNADVKQWASTTLPTLQQHLDRAKEIQGMLDKQGK